MVTKDRDGRIIRCYEGRKFVSPVIGIQGEDGRDAWIRPGELLVEPWAEAALTARLREQEMPGAPYQPDSKAGARDWRQQPGAPDYGDINAGLVRNNAGVRLWTELPDDVTVDLVTKERMAGLHLNHVLVGEDFYHGGPGGPPTADNGPTTLPSESGGDGTGDIAVLDNGLPQDRDDPALKHLVTRLGTQNIPDDPLDENHNHCLDEQAGHGLFICGLIARVAAHTDINLYRVLHATGEGDESLIINTLASLTNSSVKVVSLSLGAYTVNDVEPPLAAAIRTLSDAGKVIVAAAGNAGNDPAFRNRPFWPAAMDDVIAVGAYDSTNGGYAQWAQSNVADIYAPGVELKSNYVKWHEQGPAFDGWAKWSGTSFATPLVAAKIAELLVASPDKPPEQVVDMWRGRLPEAPWLNKHWTNSPPARRYDPQVDTTRWP
jgi:subtilisin family serine protease